MAIIRFDNFSFFIVHSKEHTKNFFLTVLQIRQIFKKQEETFGYVVSKTHTRLKSVGVLEGKIVSSKEFSYVKGPYLG